MRALTLSLFTFVPFYFGCQTGDKAGGSDTGGISVEDTGSLDSLADEEPEDEVGACEPPTGDWLIACMEPQYIGSRTWGIFSQIEDGDGDISFRFQPEEGFGGEEGWSYIEDASATIDFYGSEAGLAFLDDLYVFGDFPQILTYTGGCGWDGEGASIGALVIEDIDGWKHLGVGTGLLEDPFWLEVTRDTGAEVCDVREGEGCAETETDFGVYFDLQHPGRPFFQTLFPGQSVEDNSAKATVFQAHDGGGENYCDDATGDALNWAVRSL